MFTRSDEDKSYEENSAMQDTPETSEHNASHEFNTGIGSAYIQILRRGSSDEMPYTIEQVRHYLKNPFAYIHQIRTLARWAYRTNGVITTGIDNMRSLHTLDTVIICKSKKPSGEYPTNYRRNRSRMASVLRTIRYKQVIRDAIFRDANDGMYAAYFEVGAAAPEYSTTLTDRAIQEITEINELGLNMMVIPLPIDYIRIVGRKNNSYQIAFDLRYFMAFGEDLRKSKLRGFPKEIQEGWLSYQNNETVGPWLMLDNGNTIVTKIKSELTDPYGIPFAVAALDDICYAQYFVDTKRNVLDSVNNQIVYETFPEGRDKGTSALTEKQQRQQHDLVKTALTSKSRNSSGVSFFSLASGTKLDSISLDLALLDEKNENAIKDVVNKDIGFSASALDGSSTGNYSTANLNLELVASNVYTWIEDIVDELNKCINANVIRDSSCRVEFYVLPITMVNRDSMVKHMSDLYVRGKGSLYAWIASTGFNPDNYIALMDYELQEDFENRYPVHRTSFTIPGKDAPEHEGHNKGDDSNSPAVSDNPAVVQEKTYGGNQNPKPSTG